MKDFKIYIIGFLCLLVVLFVVEYIFINNTSTVAFCTVTGKERVVTNGTEKGKVDSKYLVFTDTETLECTDQLLLGKFNSSDIYGRIEVGKKYKFTVYGVRIPFLSTYRNIVNAEIAINKK